jgi:hypothetical protein
MIPSSSSFTIYQVVCFQVCKYPDKTERRKLKLSSKEYVSSQISILEQQDDDDDDDESHSRVQTTGLKDEDATANTAGSWMKSFRQEDAVASNKASSSVLPGSSAVNPRPGNIKRSGSGDGNDRAKKPRTVQPAFGKPFRRCRAATNVDNLAAWSDQAIRFGWSPPEAFQDPVCQATTSGSNESPRRLYKS